jgi:hypothetical protein
MSDEKPCTHRRDGAYGARCFSNVTTSEPTTDETGTLSQHEPFLSLANEHKTTALHIIAKSSDIKLLAKSRESDIF